MAASRNFAAAFSAVTAPAAPPAPRVVPLMPTERLVEFVASCETVMHVAFDDPAAAELLPGVAVGDQSAVLKAFLTYVACVAPQHEDPEQLTDWLARCQPRLWRALGFKRAPSTTTLELAFSLLCDRSHQAPGAARARRRRRVLRRRQAAAGAWVTAAQQRQHLRQRARRQQRAAAARQAAQVQSRRMRRQNVEAWSLKGATEFSADRALGDPTTVVRLFRQFAPAACLRLIERTTISRVPGVAGAHRKPGSWGLAFLAHVMSGCPDWQRWYDAHQTHSELWRACGFEDIPSWQTTYLRFRELEDDRFVSAFEEASHEFIRIAAANEPRAFRFLHTDGTPAHSHAKMEHACPSQEFCDRCVGDAPAKQLDRASDDTIAEDRHERSAEEEPDDPDAPPDNKLHKLTDDEAQQLGLSDWRNSRYFRHGVRGHVLRCRDKQVGVRMYGAGPRSKKKVWVGGYFLPAVCDFFWAPVAVHFFEADIQEHLGWPRVYRKTMRALNDDPDNPTVKPFGVVADRAFANRTFIRHNTLEGLASITPQRKGWNLIRRDRWDEHGPRCQYCDAPAAPARGAGEGFAITGTGDPRIRFRCSLGWTQDCRTKLQTISCKHEWRALLPIGRHERVFHDVLATHSVFEGVFDAWRDRYAVAGTSVATRSKRRHSIQAQKLRAAAALVAEWLRICLRQGYIGNLAGNQHEAERRAGGAQSLIRHRTYRERHMLHLPREDVTARLQLPTAPNAPPPAPSP